MPSPTALKFLLALTLPLIARSGRADSGDDRPQVQVTHIRRVPHNGQHNAFTDLCRFQDRFWLTFRTCPDGHGVHPTSSILVFSSVDGRDWQPAFEFNVPKRDVRDPHFLIFRDQLFVYTGTWYCGESSPKTYDMNQHLGYAAWTRDGKEWHGPQMLEGTYGHYIWRAASFQGRAYLCGRRKRGFAETASRQERDPLVESALLESDDGLIWRKRGMFQPEYGDETAFLFEPDGSILAVARRGGGRNAQVCRSRPPYTRFTQQDLDRYIGGPLLARWSHRLVVGGRKTVGGPARCSLYWLNNDQLTEFAELPSGGDTSYPGFVATGSDRAMVSWYSSHETDDAGRKITAVYLADLSIIEN